MRRIIFVFMIAALAGCLYAGNLVNIKYLQNQKNAKIDFYRQLTEISIKRGKEEVKILLNYPYLIYEDKVVKIDTPPFTENGELYISEYTYSKIEEILDTGEINSAEKAVEEKAEEKEIKKEETAGESEDRVKQAKAKQAKELKKEKIKEEKSEEEKKEPVKKKESPVPVTEEVKEVKQPDKKKGPKTVVIDPGHGGNDPGAIGPAGVMEKDIVLGIALRVKYNLERKGVSVYITRDSDRFISLKKRAVFANEKKADLFVSIHCNASTDSRAKGTRSYIYSRVASSKEAAEAAKLENKKVGIFEFLMNDLKKSAFEYLSIEAAGSVQHRLVQKLRLKWSPTERAPFYVLANTDMPCILVETAFISNPKEEKLLNTSSFRVKVADGITEGIMEYLDKIK